MDLTYRPTDAPASSLPFGIRSTGHYRVKRGWSEQFTPRYFTEVWYTFEGEGRFLHSGREYLAEKNTLVVLPAGIEHDLTALSGDWEYYWFTLDGKDCDSPLDWYGLTAGCYACSGLSRESFRLLRSLVGDGSFASQKKALSLVMALLSEVDIPAAEKGGDRRVELVKRLIRENFSDPSYDINRLAREAGLHRSVLSRIFTAETGQSPSEFLRELRLKTGLSLLRDSLLQVSEIAWRCGFRDPAYFSRLVQSRTGRPPRENRNHGGPASLYKGEVGVE